MRIAGYELQEEIGRGGMGIVYLARHPRRERAVALKVAHRSFARRGSEEHWFRSLFLNEMRAAAMLRHPNIVEVHEAGVEGDELYYIAMEYVAGAHTLEAFCRGERLLSVREAAEAVVSCAGALEHAHRTGIIHRDVKPANILIGERGEVKLGDFGIALLASSSEAHTQPMEPVGSPLYLSPEQIRGEPVTHRSDLFALGVVFYELLGGEHPFVAHSLTTLTHRIVNEAPAPLSRLRREVPPRLASVVERALAKAPEERYGSGLELASDIADALEVHVPAAETLARDRVEALRGLGFFRGFREADLWELLRWSDWREHRAGDAIRAEGEDERALQIVVEGEVQRFREGRALAALGRGDCFGEAGYLDGTVAGESVIARCPTAILEVRADAIERATASCRAQFQKALIGVLIRRLRESRPPPMVPEAEGEPLQ